MASLNQIGDALAERLGHISGLTVTYPWPDQFLPPGCIVQETGQEQEWTFGSNSTHALTLFHFELVCAVNMGQPLRLAQRQLAEYVSPTGTNSIRAAIRTDDSLGGVVHKVFMGEWTREDNEEINAVEHLVQRLPIQVWST